MQKRANILIILFVFIVTIASTSPVFAWDSLKEHSRKVAGNSDEAFENGLY